MIADLFADYLLALFVVAGLIACTLLGLALGCQGLTVAVRGAYRSGQRARTATRERDKARGERALALAQRDDALRQLALADAALAEASHPVQHRDDLPEQDPAVDALMRAVEEPRGTHHRQEQDAEPCQSLTRDWCAPGAPELYCEHDQGEGHDGRHTAHEGDFEWNDDGETWICGELV